MSGTHSQTAEPAPHKLRRPWLHLSTALAALPVFAIFLALNLRGELKLRRSVCEHGWPATFLEREGNDLSPWRFTEGYSSLNARALAADIATGLLVSFLILAAFEFRRRRQSLLRFSLPDLFIAMTMVAAGLSWWTYHQNQGQQEQRVIEVLRGGQGLIYVENIAPTWLARLVGRERLQLFDRVTTVRWSSNVDDDTVVELCADDQTLQSVEYLSFENSKISDVGLAAAVHARAIDALSVKETAVTGKGLKSLQSDCLRELVADFSQFNDFGLEALSEQHRLAHISLAGTQVSDKGIKALLSLPRLRWLNVSGTQVSDKGAGLLEECHSLEYVGLPLHVSDAAIQRLERALPSAKISRLLCPPRVR